MYFYLIVSILAAILLVKFFGDIIIFVTKDEYGFDTGEKIVAVLKFFALLAILFGMVFIAIHFIIKCW